jgi:hypothetical protein
MVPQLDRLSSFIQPHPATRRMHMTAASSSPFTCRTARCGRNNVSASCTPNKNGLMISADGYTQHALAERRRAAVNRVVILAEIQELLFLLERDGDVRTWLAAKLHAAKAEGNHSTCQFLGQS